MTIRTFTVHMSDTDCQKIEEAIRRCESMEALPRDAQTRHGRTSITSVMPYCILKWADETIARFKKKEE